MRSLVAGASGGMPAILAGDFNCPETEEPYTVLTDAQGPVKPLGDARAISRSSPLGPHGTFCGFAPSSEIRGPRIDYLFVTDGVAVERYETFLATRPEGFLSDHLPVIATFTFP